MTDNTSGKSIIKCGHIEFGNANKKCLPNLIYNSWLYRQKKTIFFITEFSLPHLERSSNSKDFLRNARAIKQHLKFKHRFRFVSIGNIIAHLKCFDPKRKKFLYLLEILRNVWQDSFETQSATNFCIWLRRFKIQSKHIFQIEISTY